MPLLGTGSVDFTMDVRNLSGNLTVAPAYEVAVIRTDRPSTPVVAPVVSTWESTNDTFHYRQALSSVEGSNTWIRFGTVCKNSSGTSLGRAEVALLVTFRAEGPSRW